MFRLMLMVCVLALAGCLQSSNNTAEKVDTASALARVASTFRAALMSAKSSNAIGEGLAVAMESLGPAKAAFPSPELDKIDEKAQALKAALISGEEAKVKSAKADLMKCLDEVSAPTG